MWLLMTLLALLAFGLTDLLGKKKMDEGNLLTSVKLLLSCLTLAFFIGLILAVSGWGESGDAPWRILLNHPLILLNQFCFFMYWLFYLVSFRYIGLALESAVSGVNSILYFLGLLLIHAVSGQLASFGEILQPVRLIPILVVLFFVCLYPNVEWIAHRKADDLQKKMEENRYRTVIGLLILFIGLSFDAGDTLITTLILDDGRIGIADFVTVSYLVMILPMLFLFLFLRLRTGRWYVPFRDGGWFSVSYACSMVASTLLYLYASSLDAVRTGIVFIAAPVFPLLGARFVLKETYTWRQNLCIWGIMIAVMVFCAADYI